MISSSCLNAIENVGHLGCADAGQLTDIVALLITKNSFKFSTFEDFADKTKYEDAVKAKNIIPLHGVVEIDDQSEDVKFYESPVGQRIPRRPGMYRFIFRFNKPFEVHKALQSYSGGKFKVFLIDSSNNIIGYSTDGTKVCGFNLSMFYTEKLTMAKQDGTPAWTSIAIDLANSDELNKKGAICKPDWMFSEIEPVTTVDIAVLAATAAKVTLKVFYNDGITSDGSANKIGVDGILQTDFVFTTTAPTAAAMVAKGEGVYEFPGVGMVSGTVQLKSPSTAESEGAPLEMLDQQTITIA